MPSGPPPGDGSEGPVGPAQPVVIRLPRTSYLIIVFLVLGAVPVAFSGGGAGDVRDVASGSTNGFSLGPQLLVLLVPVLAAFFVARTATIVTADGLTVRAVFGSRLLPWPTLRGLSVRGRSIYAVQDDGVTRLPCVRLAHLGPLSRLSGGHLPELADATPKPAPQRRRRR
ncbi:PH domain-containing protein [Jatrophihabitans endophyticus]|uniref:PH domain-containing protein n=1 Tax=Jatrophihabitans endophyticus TaxID=1206085 RepID=A0A1M5D9T3_9ACTN|nr:PH domain-containing protein [Jatrophihabitans endophyticus]SHF63829.1 PH domain-containing protein [Jatrophihabitans endophyticus]